MGLPVEADGANIDDREAMSTAVGQGILDTSPYGWDEISRDRSASHFAFELETGTSSERFEANRRHCVLTMTTTLFLVTSHNLDRTGQCLKVRNFDVLGLDLDAVSSKTRESDTEMRLPTTRQHRLAS